MNRSKQQNCAWSLLRDFEVNLKDRIHIVLENAVDELNLHLLKATLLMLCLHFLFVFVLET